MRAEAQRLHRSPLIHWMSDALPALNHVHRQRFSFDLILLSAVWMHVPPGERRRAFRKLLLKPGGCIAITLRHGPIEPERGTYPVSQGEIEALVREHGACIEKLINSKDELGRESVLIHKRLGLDLVSETSAKGRVYRIVDRPASLLATVETNQPV